MDFQFVPENLIFGEYGNGRNTQNEIGVDLKSDFICMCLDSSAPTQRLILLF